MNFRIYIILLLMAWGSTIAQTTPTIVESVVDTTISISDKNLLKTDSLLKYTDTQTDNPLFEKKFEDNFQKKYQTEDFDYRKSKPKTSFWARLIKLKDKILNYLFGDIDGLKVNEITNTIITIICMLAVAALLYFLIMYLMSKNGNWLFGKRNEQLNIPSHDIIDNIHDINFPQTIAQYEQVKDFRSAIRYQFLYMLKKLTDKKLIEWNPEKTNKDYLAEIAQSNLQQQFKDAAYIFDYVWYGEFSIDQSMYEQYKHESFNF